MFLSFQLTRRKIVIAAAAVVLLIAVISSSIIIGASQLSGEKGFSAATDEQRRAFLARFGWEVESTPLMQNTVIIPSEFDEVYSPYNEMQLEQGFDLTPYKGQTVSRYCYAVLNYPGADPVMANLLVFEGKIIGGDIDSPALGGFMHGFEKNALAQAVSPGPWEY
ncbi:MAG TPA: DUF4830 domain-containing protein [Ruminococcaceae bacterium]|nr:DUF4830 domain-containing protein [Oscillospiraceae bacterium]